MKTTIQVVLIAAVMGLMILALIVFGFSDWAGMSSENYEIWQTKPWRPFARLALAFVLISMICVLGGAFIRSFFKMKD